MAPLAYMRGRTLAGAFVILDEAQNTGGGSQRTWAAPDHSIGLDESEVPPPIPYAAFPAPTFILSAVSESAVGESALMAAAQAFCLDRLRGGCGAGAGGIQPCGAEA